MLNDPWYSPWPAVRAPASRKHQVRELSGNEWVIWTVPSMFETLHVCRFFKHFKAMFKVFPQLRIFTQLVLWTSCIHVSDVQTVESGIRPVAATQIIRFVDDISWYFCLTNKYPIISTMKPWRFLRNHFLYLTMDCISIPAIKILHPISSNEITIDQNWLLVHML